MVRAVANDSMVPPSQKNPKHADFPHWSELIANTVAGGPSAAEVRGYLKTVAKSTWQLVSWLTHASNAVRFDGHVAVEATQATLGAFGRAILRHERATPDRCPKCHSYKIGSKYVPTLGIEPPYVTFCKSCGWDKYSSSAERIKRGRRVEKKETR
jgi:predicted Zn-ribbon and HTH transcriptional regulator